MIAGGLDSSLGKYHYVISLFLHIFLTVSLLAFAEGGMLVSLHFLSYWTDLLMFLRKDLQMPQHHVLQ